MLLIMKIHLTNSDTNRAKSLFHQLISPFRNKHVFSYSIKFMICRHMFFIINTFSYLCVYWYRFLLKKNNLEVRALRKLYVLILAQTIKKKNLRLSSMFNIFPIIR